MNTPRTSVASSLHLVISAVLDRHMCQQVKHWLIACNCSQQLDTKLFIQEILEYKCIKKKCLARFELS